MEVEGAEQYRVGNPHALSLHRRDPGDHQARRRVARYPGEILLMSL
jgi:hypothetical protein